MYRVTVRGTPPRKNTRHRLIAPRKGAPRRINGEGYKAFVTELAREWGTNGRVRGRVIIAIVAYWPRQRHIDGGPFPFGDIDAPISCVLDGLQAIGAIDDDVRVTRLAAEKEYDPDNPRTEILIEERNDTRTDD